ncbi:MAG: hypothetical protein HYX32_07090 [Actinobacteria bacterium]|nr:hypothetical protein [Actinomycetota bacterium]
MDRSTSRRRTYMVELLTIGTGRLTFIVRRQAEPSGGEHWTIERVSDHATVLDLVRPGLEAAGVLSVGDYLMFWIGRTLAVLLPDVSILEASEPINSIYFQRGNFTVVEETMVERVGRELDDLVAVWESSDVIVSSHVLDDGTLALEDFSGELSVFEL